MRNATMLGLSLVFYAWGAPWFMPVILGLGIVDFFLARVIDRRRGEPIAKKLVVGAVTMVHR